MHVIFVFVRYLYPVHTWVVSEQYLLRTFSTQRYLYTEKVRCWYGASAFQERLGVLESDEKHDFLCFCLFLHCLFSYMVLSLRYILILLKNRGYETAIRDFACTGYWDAGKCQTDNFHKEGGNSLLHEWTRHSYCSDCFKKTLYFVYCFLNGICTKNCTIGNSTEGVSGYHCTTIR